LIVLDTSAVVERHGREPVGVSRLLRTIGLAFVPYDGDQAMRTAALEAATREAGISLGDRACLALAMRERCDVLTADRTWSRLGLPVRVELIR
jgi:PIN domain nuclease of toxin-antitoxin system